MWRKALLAKTVERMPQDAFFVAMFSAAVTVFASVVTYRDLPLAVMSERSRQRSPVWAPSGPAVP